MRWVFLILPALLILVCAAVAPASAQDQYFAGNITNISTSQITVSRTALGETSTRTFTITPETRVEGKPAVNAKVTVQFRSVDGSERAIHIIVRPQAPERKKK